MTQDISFEGHGTSQEHGTGLANQNIQWTTIVIVILTWLMSAALTYGVVSTKITNLEQRVDVLEVNQRKVMSEMLTREEYERFHQALVDKVDAQHQVLRDKIDDLILMHARDAVKKKTDAGL
jgi:hypothetical protein